MTTTTTIADYINADGNIKSIDSVFRFINKSDTWKYNPGVVELNMLLFINSGEAVFNINNKTIYVKPNDIVYLPAGSKFNSRGVNGIFDYYCIQFSFSKKNLNFPFEGRYKTSTPEFYIHIYKEMYEAWLTKTMGYKIRIKSGFYQIMNRILSEESPVNDDLKALTIIRNSVKYMEENYFSPNLNIEQIAAASGITSAHFRNLFKEIYSISPLKHINKIRISRACELLGYTNIKIHKISEEVGFTSVYHFNKIFKNIMGISPGAYRVELSNRK